LIGEEQLNSLKEKFNLISEESSKLKNSGTKDRLKQFYTKVLPDLCEQIKDILGEKAFVKLYQKIGTNIRTSGSPLNERLVGGKFFTLAEKIKNIVKELHEENKSSSLKTLIVIDAIRNPLEAIYFQDRYASFFLVAISCDDSERKQRLRKQNYNDDDIEILDKQEYQNRDLNKESTYSIQDIQGCLQRADIYISNPDEENVVSEFKSLANQVLRFVSLMKRPGLVTPTAVERCMQVAYTAKLNSGCISRQVGAVITDSNYSVKSIGWNDAPHGQVPCNLRNRFDLINGKDQLAYSTFEKNDYEFVTFFSKRNISYIPIKNDQSGRNISYCFKSEYNAFKNKDNQVHTRSLHAEENAFLQISKYGGIGIEGGNLFTTASPCELCAKKAYQLGIKKIFYIDPYPGIAMSHIIDGGTCKPDLILFSGAIGRAFHRLFTPIVAYKDELNAIKDIDIDIDSISIIVSAVIKCADDTSTDEVKSLPQDFKELIESISEDAFKSMEALLKKPSSSAKRQSFEEDLHILNETDLDKLLSKASAFL
jgi:deoxycytidylate deaminase/dephospho-CoA kinase